MIIGISRIFSNRKTLFTPLRYFSTVEIGDAKKLPEIFATSKPDFEILLNNYCELLLKKGAMESIYTSIKSDLEEKIIKLEKKEFTAAQFLRFKYQTHLELLDIALSGGFKKDGISQKSIPIDIATTQLQLITLIKGIPDFRNSRILSSFLCYQGLPVAHVANAISFGLSENNRNIHHFALEELTEKIPTIPKRILFGDKLLMSLVQFALPMLIDREAFIGYQRISCQSEKSLLAQNEISQQKVLRGVSESHSSNFKRIYQFARCHLEEVAYDLVKSRGDEEDCSIKIGDKKITPIPRRDFVLREADMAFGHVNHVELGR